MRRKVNLKNPFKVVVGVGALSDHLAPRFPLHLTFRKKRCKTNCTRTAITGSECKVCCTGNKFYGAHSVLGNKVNGQKGALVSKGGISLNLVLVFICTK